VTAQPFTVFIVAGEESGDQLGAGLMRAIRARKDEVRFVGVGGLRMVAEGLDPLFPVTDLSHHGLTAVFANLPLILRRIRETVDAAVAAAPDVAVFIDSPDFNLRVARRLRARARDIPIVDYVSPTVWAWRPGRAAAMAGHVDHLLAILPFEPEVHRRLGGPATTYVGHPLVEKLGLLRPAPGERPPLGEGRTPTLLVLPGSRRSEISRLLTPFGAAVRRLAETHPGLEVVLPAVPHLRDRIVAGVAGWPVKPEIVDGETAKFAAFRRAHAALAASGTVTLELALSGVPMVVAYRLDPVARAFKWLISVNSNVLANLVLGDNAIPEFIDADATPENLAAAVDPLLSHTAARAAQVAAFARLDGLMIPDGPGPSDQAAAIVLDAAGRRA
jgi:lipid-A-disaccharide synthase